MKTIHKFPLPQDPSQSVTVSVSINAVALYVAIQFGQPFAWYLTDPKAVQEERVIKCYGTGHDIPNGETYIGTLQAGPYVWHYFVTE